MKLALTFAILIMTIGGCVIAPDRDYRGDGYYQGNRSYYGESNYRGDPYNRNYGPQEHDR